MTYDARTLAKQCLSLAGGAAVTFAATAAVVVAFGIGIAAVSWLVISDLPWRYRAAAAAAAVVEGIAAGLFLGVKRATAGALARGLGSLHLGRMVVGFVFDKMPERRPVEGGASAVGGSSAVDRAEAERCLNEAVREVERDAAEEGTLLRAIVRRLLDEVRHYVAGRFAAEASSIDLARIRAESELAIDRRLSDRFRSGARLATLLVAAALPLVAALQILLIRKLAA